MENSNNHQVIEEEVDAENVAPRPDSDKKSKSLATYDVTARAA